MPKFQATLDEIEELAGTLLYHIRNPTAEFDGYSGWIKMIIETADSINSYALDLEVKPADEYVIEQELSKYYGVDSDGTYKDFKIPK